MLDLDRAWARLSQLPAYQGKRLADYVAQAVSQSFTLASGLTSAVTPVPFPTGAAILHIGGGARLSAAAGANGGTSCLDLFSFTLQVEGGRYIVGTQAAIASSVIGDGNFPPKELVVPINAVYSLTVTNITTSTIVAWLTFLCLVPAAVG